MRLFVRASIPSGPSSKARSVDTPLSHHCQQLVAVALKKGGATAAIGNSTLKSSAPQERSGRDGPPTTAAMESRIIATESRATRSPPVRKVVAAGHATATGAGTPRPAVAAAQTAVPTPQTAVLTHQRAVILSWSGKSARLELP